MTSTSIRLASKGLRSESRPTSTRRGFTFVELVVVISIIAALAAIGFPVWGMISTRVKVNATEALVQSVATAITTYQTKTWTWVDAAGKTRTYHIFDLNHFTPNSTTPNPDLTGAPEVSTKRFFSIDGYMPNENTTFYDGTKDPPYQSAPTESDPNSVVNPDPYDVNFTKEILNSGYRGFITMAQPSIKKSFINKRGQVIDAWGKPLRIAFAARVFGTQSFGVWSAGLDGKDSIKENDDYKDDPTFKSIDDLRSWGGDKGGK
jgi:prepilin-type N-terminal cleavage/methylation domain-containing protein